MCIRDNEMLGRGIKLCSVILIGLELSDLLKNIEKFS